MHATLSAPASPRVTTHPNFIPYNPLPHDGRCRKNELCLWQVRLQHRRHVGPPLPAVACNTPPWRRSGGWGGGWFIVAKQLPQKRRIACSGAASGPLGLGYKGAGLMARPGGAAAAALNQLPRSLTQAMQHDQAALGLLQGIKDDGARVYQPSSTACCAAARHAGGEDSDRLPGSVRCCGDSEQGVGGPHSAEHRQSTRKKGGEG